MDTISGFPIVHSYLGVPSQRYHSELPGCMASSNATIAGLRRVAFTVNASQFAAAIADANAVSGEDYPTDPALWRLGHWNVEAEGKGGQVVVVVVGGRNRIARCFASLCAQAQATGAWATRSRGCPSPSSDRSLNQALLLQRQAEALRGRLWQRVSHRACIMTKRAQRGQGGVAVRYLSSALLSSVAAQYTWGCDRHCPVFSPLISS